MMLNNVFFTKYYLFFTEYYLYKEIKTVSNFFLVILMTWHGRPQLLS